MSTLTKILIVGIVLLGIVQTVVSIQYVNSTANWKKAYLDERDKRTLADSQALLEQTKAAAALDQYKQLDTAGSRKDDDARAQARRDKAEIARLQAENARLSNMLEGMNTKLAGLEASVAEQVAMNKLLSKQLDERLAMIQDLNDQLRKTTLQAQDLSRKLETARQNVTVKQAQLTSASETIRELQEKLRSGVGISVAGVKAAPVPATRIEGRIDAVSLEDNVARINVGAASGVEVGMKFILYRGSTYVGDLTIAEADASNSAGTLSNLQVPPQRGDKAATDLNVD